MTSLAKKHTLPSDVINSDERNRLIEQYLPYVKRIVQRIAVQLPPHIDTEDLLHAGVVGLIQAVDRFDASRNIKLITYASFRIRGAILSELRDRDYLTRGARSRLRELETVSVQLEQQLGRPPRDHEVAAAMGVDLEQFFALKNISGLMFVSMEELGVAAPEQSDRLHYEINLHTNADSNNALASTTVREFKTILTRCISELSQKEQTVLALYYQEELTMKEIGAVLNVSESRISQIHAQSVLNLRKKLTRAGYFSQGQVNNHG